MAWLAATTRPPSISTTTTTLRLWGLPLVATVVANEFYAPGAHLIVRVLDPLAPLPAAPQLTIVDEVVVKTATETFHGDHQYALRNDRIWFKRARGAGGTRAEPWRLFLSGVPAPFLPRAPEAPVFRRPQKLVALSADSDWLDTAAVVAGGADFVAAGGEIARSILPRGRSFRSTWQGAITQLVDADGVEIGPVAATIDFNPWCPPHTITLHVPSGPAVVDVDVTLHSVDMWAPAQRTASPGIDGMPLLLLGTLVFTDDVLTDRRPAVRRIVAGLRAWHHKTFELLLAMDRDRLTVEVVDENQGATHPLQMAFTRTTPLLAPPNAPGYSAKNLAWFMSSALDDDVNHPTLTSGDPVKTLALNIAKREQLRVAFDDLKRPVQELEALLASPVRSLTPVLRLGRLPRIPRLFRRSIEIQSVLVDGVHVRWRTADEVLRARIETLEAAGSSPSSSSPAP